jgi:hypothetical protein
MHRQSRGKSKSNQSTTEFKGEGKQGMPMKTLDKPAELGAGG